jgi:hypothetical protein
MEIELAPTGVATLDVKEMFGIELPFCADPVRTSS